MQSIFGKSYLDIFLDQVMEDHAMIWNETCRSEKEAIRTSASLDLVKHPDPFKKEMQKQ